MRKILTVGIFVALIAVLALAGVFIFRPAEAQRAAISRFEYAVITGSYSPYPADGPTTITSAVNICFLQANGCRNEEVKTELVIGKFLQDERIENSPGARSLGQQRASEMAFSKAISRLGTEGWEMIDRPAIEFDLYYTNHQGSQSIKEGNRTERQHVWFKRERQ